MTKGAALQSFFDSIMTSYAASSVPDDATLPYLTYDFITSAWDGGEVGLTVNPTSPPSHALVIKS